MAKTLAIMTQDNWAYGGSTGFARYEFSDDFVDEDGRQFEGGSKSYLEVPTTISGSVVTVPSYPNFPTTESAIINNGVTVTCHLLDSNRVKRTTLFENVRIYTSLPSPVTLSQLVLANGASRLLRDTDVWTKEQVIDYINTLPPATKATDVAAGIMRLSVAAADPLNPVAAGDNDPRLAVLSLPQFWLQERSTANPVITINAGVPDRALEQYVPHGIKLPNGDIWVYVKGTAKIYAWKSTDSGATFAIQNSGNPVINLGTSGAWDDTYALEPAVAYDSSTDTIHLYYKGYKTATATWNIGHATASGAAPTVFTKDAANPIITSAAVQTALGIVGVNDISLNSIVKVGSTYNFFGYVATSGEATHIWRATSSTWASGFTIQPTALLTGGPSSNVSIPSVFRLPNARVWTMIYTEGSGIQIPTPAVVAQAAWRKLAVAVSRDLITWQRVENGTLLYPDSTTGTVLGWEAQQAYAGSMLTNLSGEPETFSGRHLLLYSGLGNGVAQTGILWLTPSMTHTPRPSFDGTRRDFPLFEFRNPGYQIPATLTTNPSANGVALYLGSNFFIGKDGNFYNYDTTKPYAALGIGNGGAIGLYRRNSGGVAAQPALLATTGGVFVYGNGVFSSDQPCLLGLKNTTVPGTTEYNIIVSDAGTLVILKGADDRVVMEPDGDISTIGDVEITTSAKGIILKAPDGTRYRVTVSNAGALVVTAV